MEQTFEGTNVPESGANNEPKAETTNKSDLAAVSNEPSNDLTNETNLAEEIFDQDLVEAFLEMESAFELVEYINDMDKARLKEIGYVLYQAFNQRLEYEEVKRFFKTEQENPLNFDEATVKITEALLVTSKFKKLSKYVRVQILYGLDLIKKNQEAPTLSQETLEFVDKNWRNLKVDCIRQFCEIINFDLTNEKISELIKAYNDDKKIIEAMELVQEFELFDVELDWEKGIKTLIDSEQFDKLIVVLEHKNEYIQFSIDLLSNNKLVKHASKLIDKMGLNPDDFPKVKERLAKKTIRYYVYNYINGPSSRDFMPLWKIEDLFKGYNQMIAYICEDLSFKKDFKHQKFAKALALRNGIYDLLRQDVQEFLDGVHIEQSDMNIDCVPDVFSTLSKPTDEYFKLPEDIRVTFIGTDEEVKLCEPLLHSSCLGVDCEWRPNIVKEIKSGVALLQIGDLKDIFLIDMIALRESEVLDELLCRVFSNDKTNIIGMSFHNDLAELSKGAPNLKFYKYIENLYDVQPIYASLYKTAGVGLSKIVDAVIGKKVCKVEQMANWELRPLRKSQQHYGALDAYILVELFDRLKDYAKENDVIIEDYKNTYVSGKDFSAKTKGANPEKFKVHGTQLGKANVKTIKLKSGQHLATNSELESTPKPDKLNFMLDYNLNKLNKLLSYKEFDSVKIVKNTNQLERGNFKCLN